MALRKAQYWRIAVCVFALILVACVRAWPQFVPWGASIEPFILASFEGPSMTSPDGQRVVTLYFNDAGAMHSGNHWTWIVEDHWLIGPRVVSEGYLASEHAQGNTAIPINWLNENDFEIDFAPDRYH